MPFTSSRDAGAQVDHLQARASEAVTGFVASQRELLANMQPQFVDLADAVAALVSHGKRIRPLFGWIGWRLSGGDNRDEAVQALTSLELLHACALIHDDVMDQSDTRRGQPSTHRLFENWHGQRHWQGDASVFGQAGAILAGDLCLSWCDEMYFGSGLDSGALLAAKPILDIMRTEVVAGQYLDMARQAEGVADTASALTVARYKSAKYTIERPLHLGARLAGCDDDRLDHLSAYGLPLGEAFQLRDDLLGVFGDPTVTGKPAGDDIREGKQTVLISHALAHASAAEAQELTGLLGNAAASDSQIARAQAILTAVGSRAATEELITERTAEALAAIDDAASTDAHREILRYLVALTTVRTS